jgi:hemolysin activation/secretion protein
MAANLQPDLLDLVARDREASRVFLYHALCGVDAAITAIDAEARSKAKEQEREQAERAEQPPVATATTAPTVAEPNDSAWPTPAMLEATASFEAAVIKFLGMEAVSDNDAAEAANLTSLAKGH